MPNFQTHGNDIIVLFKNDIEVIASKINNDQLICRSRFEEFVKC